MPSTIKPADGKPNSVRAHGARAQAQLPDVSQRVGTKQGGGSPHWMIIGSCLSALVAIAAAILALVALSRNPANGHTSQPAATSRPPTLAQAKGMPYEKFTVVDPTLPAVPAGSVKKFTVGVMQHITQVDPKLAPIQAWTYTVNGVGYRGTAASPPIVVNQGDRVQITFVNGTSKAMGVNMAHSIDFHAAHLAPSKYYVDIAPGQRETFSFIASSPGVFMYHCATQPVLTHTGSGMTGMMVVKPHGLPPVARELWITQQEFYIGQPGGIADQAKLLAENPDVVAFNGYANQYKIDPIPVPFDEPIRMWVLDAGPSKWTAFHVIGTLFDTTDVEGVAGHGSQTVSLAPSQGAWVQFTLSQQGNYPFVTHDFGDMARGAAGILHTPGAPPPKGLVASPTGGSSQPVLPSMISSAMGATSANSAGPQAGSPSAAAAVQVTMGEMWIRASNPSAKAGRLTFSVRNTGQMPHRFAVVRAPVKLAGLGPDPATALVKTDSLNPGDTTTLSATFAAGRYELVCLEPGHYSAGQHVSFTVTD